MWMKGAFQERRKDDVIGTTELESQAVYGQVGFGWGRIMVGVFYSCFA